MSNKRIAAAARHVEQGRRIIERQREAIAKLKKLGKDTAHSEKLLALFERTLVIFENDLNALLKERQRKAVRPPKSEP